MFSFLFASLFSWIFWLLYLGIGLFVGTFLTRTFAKKTYDFIFKNYSRDKIWAEHRDSLMIEAVPFIFIVNYLLWPIVVIIYGIIIFIKFMFSNLLRNMIIKVDSMIPDIEIKTKKGNE